MGDIAIAPEKVIKAGLVATYKADCTTTDTYTVRNTGRMILHIIKAGAGDCVVTIQTPALVGGLAVDEVTVTVVANTGRQFIGPFPPSIFNNGNGDLKFTLSDILTMTVAVLEI